MKELPVVILAFANSRDIYLENLNYESKSIIKALAPLEDQGAIRIYREESADTEAILNAVNRFDGAIVFFHYAGHADDDGIELADTKGHVAGLASLLGRQPQLKLVFLNGCSTYEQVAFLLEQSVPAVIATHKSVDDQMAAEFAISFYQKLAAGGTIKKAFDYACDSLALKYGEFNRPAIYRTSPSRGLALREKGQDPDLNWGLYFSEENPDVLNWKFPTAKKRRRSWLRLLGFFLLLVLAIIFLVKPPFLFSEEIITVEMQVQSISFLPLKREKLSPRIPVQDMAIDNFDKFTIKGGRLLDSVPENDLNSIEINALPGANHRASASLQNLHLSDISFTAKDWVTVEKTQNSLQMTGVLQTIKGNYDDTLNVFANYVQSGGKEYKFNALDQSVVANTDQFATFHFSSEDKLINLFFTFHEGAQFDINGPISIEDIQTVKFDPKPSSSVLKGMIQVGDKEIEIKSNETIDGTIIHYLAIEKIQVKDAGIWIHLSGRINPNKISKLKKMYRDF